ncbi:UvrD-helicase domain-containing protein [Mycoplasmopsis glycophila]|uniref:DNA helicase IV n=1 Tax=Mycoplasmopsis glycophila TaxID=171285 RepID=A0A449AU44_9BACT|nr:UvrD-helicase domain-containing protein [Mycoplasmopsis glycophila]VEU70027.1 DNA helicase IV [Mycoplasmopsis glycophila]
MKISNEQLKIFYDIFKGHNVKINAVAGSGKTTTVLTVSKLLEEKKILLFTYNRALMEETKQRAEKEQIYNLDVYTFHSFAQKFYKVDARTDDGLIKLIQKENVTPSIMFSYDLIIIDEAQDLTPIYYHFAENTVRKDNLNSDHNLMILGDEKQCIYEFLGSSPLFLKRAEAFFKSNKEWKELNLSTSFRLTSNNALLINKIFYNKEIIKYGNRQSNDKINYFYLHDQNLYLLADTIYKKAKTFGAENIMILSPSVDKFSLVNNLIKKIDEIDKYENLNKTIYIYQTKNDNDKVINEIETRNKLVFSTYHQAKGIERDIVFVLSFDESYYDSFAKKFDRKKVPNITYVACTRARKELWLVHNVRKSYLPWISPSQLEKNHFITFWNKSLTGYIKPSDNQTNKIDEVDLVATELVKFLDYKVDNLIKSFFSVTLFETPISTIPTTFFKQIPNQITFKNSENKEITENVSNINGSLLAVNALIKKDAKLFVLEFNKLLKERRESTNPKIRLRFDSWALEKIEQILKKITKQPLEINEILFITIVFSTLQSGNIVQLSQIPEENLNWLTKNDLEMINKMFGIFLPESATYEFRVTHNYRPKNNIIKGDIDAIDDENKVVYEFKFTNDVQAAHFYQLAIYKYLLLKLDYDKYKEYQFVLFNIKNNYSYKLEIEDDKLEEMIKILVDEKTNQNVDDELFEETFIKINKDKKNLNLKNVFLNDEIKKINKAFEKMRKNDDLISPTSVDAKEEQSIAPTQKHKPFVIIDFETWNFHENPVQLAILDTSASPKERVKEYYFQPEPTLNMSSVLAANVDEKKVNRAPSFKEQWPEIKKFFNGNYIIIAHNASFDISVLRNKLLKISERIETDFLYFDSIKIFKNILQTPKEVGYKQEILCTLFGIKYDAHNATEDVVALYKLIDKAIGFEKLSLALEENPKLINSYFRYLKRNPK